MITKDYFVLADKYTEDYSMCFKLLLPYVIWNEHSEFRISDCLYKLSMPTQIMLTNGEKSITILIRVLGFGLSFYFRSNE
jgi:hypothetical protein